MKKVAEDRTRPRSVDLVALAGCVQRFSMQKVVLFGDFVADEFQFGEITRVSREAPVLILKHRETQLVPGGGANATNNLAALGARVIPVTAVGEDAAGDALVAHFRTRRVPVAGVVRVKGWRTPTKSRFLAGWAHTVSQQVLRVDREPSAPLPAAAGRKIEKALFQSLRGTAALAVSDYGFGVVTPEAVDRARQKLRAAVPITLDSRYDLTRFLRSGITSATPNEGELEALRHVSIGRDIAALKKAGRDTMAAMRCSSLLVTRGKDGMVLFEKDGHAELIPVHGSDQAVDVTGAGDTVLAAFTLALACGASALEAAHIANIAGGLVVMKRGTATVSQQELLGAIRQTAEGGAS